MISEGVLDDWFKSSSGSTISSTDFNCALFSCDWLILPGLRGITGFIAALLAVVLGEFSISCDDDELEDIVDVVEVVKEVRLLLGE